MGFFPVDVFLFLFFFHWKRKYHKLHYLLHICVQLSDYGESWVCTWYAFPIARPLVLAGRQHLPRHLLLLSHREPQHDHMADWVILVPSLFVPWLLVQRITLCPMDTASFLLHHISPSHSVWNHCACYERVSYFGQTSRWNGQNIQKILVSEKVLGTAAIL